MNQVFGKANLLVSVDVKNETEKLALLEANYQYDPNRFVSWELTGIDCKGNRHKVNVHDCEMNLSVFEGY
jgi:hypothetical protein